MKYYIDKFGFIYERTKRRDQQGFVVLKEVYRPEGTWAAGNERMRMSPGIFKALYKPCKAYKLFYENKKT